MKRAVIRSNFCGAMQSKARSGCHVATSPRRDVTKSRRRVNNAEVNNSATSQRLNVATSQRLNVVTSPRRDVSSKICTSSFNVRTAQKLGYREAHEERHGIPEQIDTDFEEVPGICTVSHC